MLLCQPLPVESCFEKGRSWNELVLLTNKWRRLDENFLNSVCEQSQESSATSVFCLRRVGQHVHVTRSHNHCLAKPQSASACEFHVIRRTLSLLDFFRFFCFVCQIQSQPFRNKQDLPGRVEWKHLRSFLFLQWLRVFRNTKTGPDKQRLCFQLALVLHLSSHNTKSDSSRAQQGLLSPLIIASPVSLDRSTSRIR